MIEYTRAYVVNGATYSNLLSAQMAAIEELLSKGGLETEDARHAAKAVLASATNIIDILTTTTKSRPRARKVHGGTKSRKLGQDRAPVVCATPDNEPAV